MADRPVPHTAMNIGLTPRSPVVRMPSRIKKLLFALTAVSLPFQAVLAQPTTPQPTEAPSAAAPASPPRHLQKIIVADSLEAAKTFVPPADSKFVAFSPNLSSFDVNEVIRRMAGGEKRPIEEKLVEAVGRVLESFFHHNGFPTATIAIPNQSIAEGSVRFIVTLGPSSAELAQKAAASTWKIRNITIQGENWFSEKLLRQKLGIETGGTIRYTDLDQAIGWTNDSPFRRVQVKLDPVHTTGEADLTIAVVDVMPLRFQLVADNAGNDIIGRNRYIAALSYANMWGLDHQASYQYITSSKPEYFQAHALEYRVPLRRRHYLQFNGSYLKVQPELFNGAFVQEGETITADLRYAVPVKSTNVGSLEVYGAFSFKQSNNNLTWDPYTNPLLVSATKTDIFQFSMGASAVRRDKRGGWALGANLTASPGDINSRNTDAAFDGARHGGLESVRVGAESTYLFGSLSVQRLTVLGRGFDWMARGVVQASVANLLPSEQLTIGGASTVRGFNESTFAGDHGYTLSNEVLSPTWKQALPRISKRRGPLETRALVFVDAGHTGVRARYGSDSRRAALVSAGLGARMSLATNFSLTADYGWQISDLPYDVENHSRAHLRATLAF